ncbi:hypothetical protein ACWGDX_17320 [Streptomyces sp. NPDC055025]
MISRSRILLAFGATGALAALIGIPLASASESPAKLADTAPYAVEDYSYPDAANIEATKGIKLIRGDGHIVLTECDQSASQITVMTVKDETANRDGIYCFKATAKTGYLTLEVPRVFYLEATDHPFTADLTADGKTQTVSVAKDGFASVGEGTIGGARSTLVEIRVTG